MTEELQKKFRPKTLKDMIGQLAVRKTINQKLKKGNLPHALLLYGPTGCGKTTLGRCLQTALDCSNRDFIEINAATSRGIDTVREISQKMTLSPMGGKSRIWMIDEAHQLSKDAQNGMLKPLEDPPDHVYFIICTTDPQKLIPTFKGRCTQYALAPLSDSDLGKLLDKVSEKIELELDPEVKKLIVETSEGSARKALVFLDSIQEISDVQTQRDLIQNSDTSRQAIELARMLLKKTTSWSEITPILKEVSEDPETIRHIVLGYMTSCALSNNKGIMDQAFAVIEAFRDNWYDSKRAGLVAACYEVVHPS